MKFNMTIVSLKSSNRWQKTFYEIKKKGYSKIKLFTKNDIENIKKQIALILNKKNQTPTKFSKDILSKYHQMIHKEEIHKIFTNPENRHFKLEKKIIKKIQDNKNIEYLVQKTWHQKKFDIKFYLNKTIRKNYAAFRLARPYKLYPNDVGGAHLDLHFNNKIYQNHNILYTIWAPINGFSKKYTLRIAPNSHNKKHDIKNLVKQNKYISKIFKNDYLKKFKFKRIDMQIGEVLIFHPNLLHGGSKNFGSQTRVSVDFRIYNTSLI